VQIVDVGMAWITPSAEIKPPEIKQAAVSDKFMIKI
jgi:hypothetical protein